jgi:hypothetical protein
MMVSWVADAPAVNFMGILLTCGNDVHCIV